jgi:hypothetical protein
MIVSRTLLLDTVESYGSCGCYIDDTTQLYLAITYPGQRASGYDANMLPLNG